MKRVKDMVAAANAMVDHTPAAELTALHGQDRVTFVDLFLEEFELRGEGLANVNLDTGRPDVEERGYGGLQRSLDLLRRIGGHLPALPSPDSSHH